MFLQMGKEIIIPKNPIIWCDCDGVLADMIGGLCEVFNRENNTSQYRSEDVTQWEIIPYFGEKVYEKFTQRGFWESLKIHPEASDLIKILKEGTLRWGILTVTHHFQSPLGAYERTNWFVNNFGENHSYWDYKLVFAPNKSYVVGKNILIDDKFSTCLEVVKTGGVPICVARPWNEREYKSYQREDFPYGFFPRFSLDKVVEIIDQLER